jgi:NADH-quinone oxidoreductase subunit N
MIFLCSAGSSRSWRRWIPILTFITIHIALFVALGCHGGLTDGINFVTDDGSLKLTSLSRVATLISIVVGLLLVLVSWYPDRSGVGEDDNPAATPAPPSIAAEYFALMLIALSGLLLTFVANNLVVLFLALEMVSMPTYAMVALSRARLQAKEAGLKYFFLGALAAGIMVYGFSFLYGLTGTIQLDEIGNALARNPSNPYYVLAIILVIVGLCFKIAAVPMHFYAADVYQGAACTMTALLAFLPKFAGFYVLLLIIKTVVGPLVGDVSYQITAWLLWVLAAATMTTGNVLALVQRNVKRLLAYSSVTHTGYIMLALLAWPYQESSAENAVVFYISVYALATLGAFAILSLMESRGDEAQQITDLRGLGRRHPALALGLTVCVFSLVGMPLTGGFIGKFYVFSALASSDALSQTWIITLLIIALVNIPIAAGYYLKIIAACYLDDGDFIPEIKTSIKQYLGIAIAVVFTIILGIAPRLLLNLF